jgi:hypothetical protein
MKRYLFPLALVGVCFLTSFPDGRPKLPPPDPYEGYLPYFMERAELERSVSYSAGAREMVDPGKLWVSGDNKTIYVVERYKGVHIIDNTIPATPERTGFIIAPGCMDIAVKDIDDNGVGDIIYLDNAVDLVAFSLSSHAVTSRLKDYFPEPLSPNGRRYSYDYYYERTDGKIVVGWKKQ